MDVQRIQNNKYVIRVRQEMVSGSSAIFPRVGDYPPFSLAIGVRKGAEYESFVREGSENLRCRWLAVVCIEWFVTAVSITSKCGLTD